MIPIDRSVVASSGPVSLVTDSMSKIATAMVKWLCESHIASMGCLDRLYLLAVRRHGLLLGSRDKMIFILANF